MASGPMCASRWWAMARPASPVIRRTARLFRRSKCRKDFRWNAATLWAGPKCHIVHYPLKGWKVFNLVVTYHNDVKEAVAGKAVPVEEVKRGFEHVHPRAQRIIEHGSNWKLWVWCDREPTDRGVEGGVVL